MDVPGLVESKLSNENIGFDPKEVLEELSKGRRPLYRKSTQEWVGLPFNGSEEAVALYLQKVADAVRPHVSKDGTDPRTFHWSAQFSNKPVPHPSCQRKPDLVLLGDTPATGWDAIKSMTELKARKDKGHGDAFDQLSQSARLIFESQPNRRFILSSMLLTFKAKLVLHDRLGVLVSKVFDVHKEPELFLRVFIGLMFASDAALGFDPTMSLAGEEFILVNGNKYTI